MPVLTVAIEAVVEDDATFDAIDQLVLDQLWPVLAVPNEPEFARLKLS